jgi:hypothetical protein
MSSSNRRSQSANGKFLRARQKLAAVHPAVNVPIKEIEQALREIGCFVSLHGSISG